MYNIMTVIGDNYEIHNRKRRCARYTSRYTD